MRVTVTETAHIASQVYSQHDIRVLASGKCTKFQFKRGKSPSSEVLCCFDLGMWKIVAKKKNIFQ